MTPPALAALRFGWAIALGAILAVWYGFLRPIRPRAIADLLFFPAVLYAWCILSFQICRGDIRMGITLGLAVGFFLWDRTLGFFLNRVFRGFWGMIFGAWRCLRGIFIRILKKIWYFRKFFLASRKKSGTI
ncbi:MAG: hypothetical protein E7437_09310 [Ruminococcaceae bacterium]|nr:hypothetical protein [Oscillospiraceae bacterium]